MTPEQFKNACCNIAGIENLKDLGEEFLNSALKTADLDNSGVIEFDEFLQFFQTFSFSEEFSLKSDERVLRSIARNHGLSYQDADAYKAEFDKVDEDKSGLIE